MNSKAELIQALSKLLEGVLLPVYNLITEAEHLLILGDRCAADDCLYNYKQSLQEVASYLVTYDPDLASRIGELCGRLTSLSDKEITPIILGEERRVYELILSRLLAAVELHHTESPGAENRIKLINDLMKKFFYRKYLEIGCRDDKCFSQIDIEYKVGLDPVSGGTIRTTSDDYFASGAEEFDLVFVDGLHHAEQAFRDITNALKVLTANGAIVVHDCNPLFEVRQIVPSVDDSWNGDVWKALLHFRQDPNLDIAVGNFDYGCAVIRQRANANVIALPCAYTQLTWQMLVNNRGKWLNLKSAAELMQWV